MGFPGGSNGKEFTCNAGDLGSIPRLGRSSGEENGNILHYSFLENSMDRGAWWATVHGIAKSQAQLSDYTHIEDLFINFCELLRPGWVWRTTSQNGTDILWLLSASLGVSRNSPSHGKCHFRYLLGVLVDVKWKTKKSVPLISSAEVTFSWDGSPYLGLGNWVQEAMPPGKTHQFITLHIHPGFLWWLRW